MFAIIPGLITEGGSGLSSKPRWRHVAGALGSAAVSSALIQLTSLLVVSETTSWGTPCAEHGRPSQHSSRDVPAAWMLETIQWNVSGTCHRTPRGRCSDFRRQPAEY